MDVSSRDRLTTDSVRRGGVRYTSLTTTISHDNNNHRTIKHASTSWRCDGSPSCLGGPQASDSTKAKRRSGTGAGLRQGTSKNWERRHGSPKV